MKKSVFLPLFILTIIIGSFVNFYASNLLFSDVCNFFMQGNFDLLIISTWPALMLAVDFILIALFLTRYHKRPDLPKRLTRLYTVGLATTSLIGLVTSILSGTVVYGSFISDNIFPCYSLIGTIVHGVLIILACVLYYFEYKMPDDGVVYRVQFKQVMSAVGQGLFLFFVFNRTGAILWSPSFIQVRTLYATWSLYLWTLLPLAMLILMLIQELGWYKHKKKYIIISNSVVLTLNLVIGITFSIMAINDTTLNAAISPIMPLSRLASMPVEMIVIFLVMFIWPLVKIIMAAIEKAPVNQEK